MCAASREFQIREGGSSDSLHPFLPLAARDDPPSLSNAAALPEDSPRKSVEPAAEPRHPIARVRDADASFSLPSLKEFVHGWAEEILESRCYAMQREMDQMRSELQALREVVKHLQAPKPHADASTAVDELDLLAHQRPPPSASSSQPAPAPKPRLAARSSAPARSRILRRPSAPVDSSEESSSSSGGGAGTRVAAREPCVGGADGAEMSYPKIVIPPLDVDDDESFVVPAPRERRAPPDDQGERSENRILSSIRRRPPLPSVSLLM